MERGGGMSLWSKTMLHTSSHINVDLTIIIVVKACGFCSGWYNCYNIVVTSYKHTYHPFCLGEMLKKNKMSCLSRAVSP